MITLITGVPGSGKSLHAVSDLLVPMQGAEIEHEGAKVKRILHTNIKNLLLDHVHIDKEDLLRWPEWCKPGDLICFDEVQEVWRPRSMGAQTPDSIAKLETHRHMGVDFVIITQHPMLLDQNIRRLVGRHLHVRRVANMPLAVVYEWDHASNPSMVKSAITTRPWRYPKSAYKLYKSAEAHTKQPRRLPFALLVLLVAVVGLGYGVYTMQDRLSERYGSKPANAAVASAVNGSPGAPVASRTVLPGVLPVSLPVLASALPVVVAQALNERPLGCIANNQKCSCYDQTGYLVPMTLQACQVAAVSMSYIVRETSTPSRLALPAPTSANTEKQVLGGDPLGEGAALKSPEVQHGPVEKGPTLTIMSPPRKV